MSYILISLPVVCRTCYCYIAIEHEVNAGKYKCCKRSKWSKTSTHSMALPLFLTVGASRISAVRPRALPHMETQVFCKQHSQSSVKSIGQAVKSCHLATSSLDKKSEGLDCEETLSIPATKPKDSSREQGARMIRFVWSLVNSHFTKQVCAAWLSVRNDN